MRVEGEALTAPTHNEDNDSLLLTDDGEAESDYSTGGSETGDFDPTAGKSEDSDFSDESDDDSDYTNTPSEGHKDEVRVHCVYRLV